MAPQDDDIYGIGWTQRILTMATYSETRRRDLGREDMRGSRQWISNSADGDMGATTLNLGLVILGQYSDVPDNQQRFPRQLCLGREDI
jgi:hypothetical protein